jgi:uncharacterized cupin superfamily protein
MSVPTLPALDPASVKIAGTKGIAVPLQIVAEGRLKRRLSPELGLTNIGVNHTTLEPGAASSYRHWHKAQDEFVYIISGEVTLITDAGSQILKAGMCAGFPKGKADGHRLVNHTKEPAVVLEVGDRGWPDEVTYPDDDMHAAGLDKVGVFNFTDKKGTPYPRGE